MADKDNELNEFDNPQDYGDFADGSDLDPIDDADFESLDDDTSFDNDPADIPPEAIQEGTQKKSSNMFTFIVIGAAVVIGGGLIAVKALPSLMGGEEVAAISGTSEDAPAVPQSGNGQPAVDPSQQAAQQAVQPEQSQQPPAPEAGLLQNPDQLANLSAKANALSTGEQLSAENRNVFSALNNGEPVPATDVPQPAPITSADPQSPWPPLENQPPVTAEALPGTVPDASAVLPATPDTQTAAIPAQTAAADTGLQQQVDTLNRRLDEMNTKLDAAVQKVDQVASSSNGAAMTSIQETLVRLEKRLDDMATGRAPVREVSASAGDEKPAVRRSSSSTKKAKTARKSSGTRAASSQWDAPYNPNRDYDAATASGSTPAKASSASRGGWELRGAQPGSALVAKSGSDDIREVAVGDTISGIGRVTGIVSQGGNWIVQGTSGNISQ